MAMLNSLRLRLRALFFKSKTWVLTLPVAAILAGGSYWLLKNL
jgi:phosphate/sulfate permease